MNAGDRFGDRFGSLGKVSVGAQDGMPVAHLTWSQRWIKLPVNLQSRLLRGAREIERTERSLHIADRL